MILGGGDCAHFIDEHTVAQEVAQSPAHSTGPPPLQQVNSGASSTTRATEVLPKSASRGFQSQEVRSQSLAAHLFTTTLGQWLTLSEPLLLALCKGGREKWGKGLTLPTKVLGSPVATSAWEEGCLWAR